MSYRELLLFFYYFRQYLNEEPCKWMCQIKLINNSNNNNNNNNNTFLNRRITVSMEKSLKSTDSIFYTNSFYLP